MNRYAIIDWMLFGTCAAVVLGWCLLAAIWTWRQRCAVPAHNYGIEVVLDTTADDDDFNGHCAAGEASK